MGVVDESVMSPPLEFRATRRGSIERRVLRDFLCAHVLRRKFNELMKDCDIDSGGQEKNDDTEEGRDDSDNAPCDDSHIIRAIV